ncbi:mucin-binding protein [Liquorilactobacillus cacaonum]|uniref:Mucus-binding protein n=1 Tax=Liquorilactobacillus cacaonum DSM 21116 TaxID=1423729 RepID=A0A0R2CZS5_9LACO|nr:MucBP domain-containing protein [Liquorilactobacillus cacaonum]KRM92803.1 mucus-binding protein [Liquorilactobacillus cacaonum DSM 21116]
MKKFFAIILSFVFGMFFLVPNHSLADTVQRLGNSYQYVSDDGVAKFNIPWRGKGTGALPGISYDGNLTFWTEPGTAGTAVLYGQSDTVKTTSVNGSGEIPAYAANNSSTPIGTWILPTGNVPENSTQQIELILNSANKNFAGVIRPLKVSLSATDPAGLWTYWNSGSSTFYPLTLTSTSDSNFPITGNSGEVVLNDVKGSYLNTSSQPSSSTGETTMNTVEETAVSLVNSTGEDVESLAMIDANGNDVGTWKVSEDKSKITWELNGNTITGPIESVKYTVRDVRTNSWSGWWSQLPSDSNNVLGGAATYDIANLNPQIGKLTTKYVDENGMTLSSESNSYGYIGQSYETNEKSISGYSFKKIEGSSNGTYSDENQTVTYIYARNQGNVNVKYVDDTTGKILSVKNMIGNVGDELTYTTADTIANYIGQGYKLVSDNFPANDNYTEDNQNYEVHLVHDTVTVNPENPQVPGTAINPNNPNGPKWLTGTDKSSLTKLVNEIIHYKYADGTKAASDMTDSVTFNHEIVIDKVTGKIVKDNGWRTINDDTTFDAKVSPTIEGYTPDQAQIDEVKGLTPDSADVVKTVTYTKDIVPVVPIVPTNNDKNSDSTALVNNVVAKKTVVPTAVPPTKASLPQTGNEQNTRNSIIGAILVVLAAVGTLFGIGKRNKKQSK